MPLVLFFSHGGWATAVAAVVMLVFHFGIPTPWVGLTSLEVRRRVRFLRANLYRDAERALMGRFDLILCRNVLLYFDAPARVRVVA